MNELFLTVLNMSLTASIAAIVVIIVRIILKKSPKVFSYGLWVVVLFRLLIPFTFETPFSLMPENTKSITENLIYLNNNENAEFDYVNNSIISNNTGNINNTEINNFDASNNPLETQVSTNDSKSLDTKSNNIFIEVGSIIWITGIIILISYSTITYIKLHSNLRTATLVRENIFETDRIKTPFVMGIIRPRIIIPVNLSDTELKYIIMHENTHINRGDNIIKPLAFLALVIHWFNPVIWISYYLMVKDMEMSCDESVMNNTNEDIRGNYSNSLLSLSIKQSGLLTPLAFGESNVKSRIKNVLNYKKPSFWMILMLIVFLIVVAVSIGTNKIRNNYNFSGMTSIQAGDYYFLLEDTPKNIQEEIVYLNFLYTFEKTYDKKYEILADTETHKIIVENEKKDADPNIYTSYVLHSISTVIDKQSQNVENIVKQYNLSEYEIINVTYTQKHSLNKLLLGPQWGDGTYSRNFIVGKKSSDENYKIFDFLMPLGVNDSEINSVILSNFIQLFNYENYELTSERTITDAVSKININMILMSGNTSSMKSNSDVPQVGHYIKVVLNGSEENYKENGIYYVYEINSKYYIEKPNEYIKHLTYDEFRDISNYNRLGTVPNPVYISMVITNVTEEEYKATGNDTEVPDLNDFRKIQFKLYIEYPYNIKNRKVEISSLYDLYKFKVNEGENRLRGGSSFEQDNESENFAIYEHDLIIDVKALDDNDIIDILKSKEVSVSWTDINDYFQEFKYNLGDVVIIK